MEYRYEVSWDSTDKSGTNVGGVHRYVQDFLDIGEARQCLIMMRGRNATMKVIPVGYEERR